MSSNRLRVGVDIGGTFTDIVIMDPDAGTTVTHKVPSTPADPGLGMLAGLDQLGITGDIGFLVHGTTAGLNAILARAGERIALLTTEGFRDVILLQRAGNPNIWSLRSRKPEPLVAEADIHTVRERIRHDGSVEVALAEEDVARFAAWLEAEGVSSVAVCLLHAHLHSAHELAVARMLRARLPGLSVVLSHEVAPEQGEFERSSTTVATGYVSRTIDRYLATLVRELRARECPAPLHVMRSSGGICGVQMVAGQPIQTILSGPAGGVVAVETVARTLGRANVIGIDMGGTSSDVSMVVDGAIALAAECDIAGQVMKMPVVELHTIGAGGGSIARAEAGGLRVGPQSAGVTPGPACYGRGGERPTVTDAQVLLGRIDPDWFLGGQMKLDAAAAKTAIGSLAGQIGLDAMGAAEGILAVANGMMANAIRTLTMRRGIDVRDFSLLAFGGAGPLHGVALAEELGIDEVIVPFGTGVLSAWGMLHADIRHDVSAPLTGRVGAPETQAALSAAIETLRTNGAGLLAEEGVPDAARDYAVSLDMRYVGQEHSILVPMRAGENLAAAFHDAYRARFGHAMPAAPIEIVQARLAATGRVGAQAVAANAARETRPGTTRTIRIAGADHSASIVHREAMAPTDTVTGPAVILEAGSTTLVPPGWTARHEAAGALIIRKTEA
ncbi:MAG: hydantoinase/oxoprolinase family protein [Candidatus Andeanibacterium colombiense]|uniref:Hydantoinase/oxoprolinase family protein n=1 Tax=Candidatus Andeanibacterium colombiense TaxID=3121345 RepID=A0AAJ5X8M3_9SPHN|nr:MAG: hydantoinase/oxoprolinase family protein [Sphingomonadaceae bacterium]